MDSCFFSRWTVQQRSESTLRSSYCWLDDLMSNRTLVPEGDAPVSGAFSRAAASQPAAVAAAGEAAAVSSISLTPRIGELSIAN